MHLKIQFKKPTDFKTVNVCSTEDLQSVQSYDHQIPIIFQNLAPIDSHLTGCGSQGWLSDRKCLSLSKDCSLGMRVATIPGRARSCSLGLLGAATGKGLSCCSPPSSPCGWLLAVLGTSETWEALGETRLGRTCFLFLVIPELPLALGCALSTLACSSCNNIDDDNHMMVIMTLIIITLIIVIIIQVRYIELMGTPCLYFLSINPLSPNINMQILLTDLNTFSYSISWENLLKDQSKFHLVTISFY